MYSSFWFWRIAFDGLAHACFVAAASAMLLLCATSILSTRSLAHDESAAEKTETLFAIGTDFEFLDNDGRLRTVSSLAPSISAVYFGYSNCPDVCPGTLAKMVAAKRLLGKQGDMLHVIFTTIDPARDTRIALNNYLALFDADFIGARLLKGELEKVAKKFAIYYQRVDHASGILFGHSSGIYLFDRQGRPADYLPADSDARELAESMKKLIG